MLQGQLTHFLVSPCTRGPQGLVSREAVGGSLHLCLKAVEEGGWYQSILSLDTHMTREHHQAQAPFLLKLTVLETPQTFMTLKTGLARVLTSQVGFFPRVRGGQGLHAREHRSRGGGQ